MSLLDALDLDAYIDDTFDTVEFYDVRYINDELLNECIGVRGYIVKGEESCWGQMYQVPLHDNMDHNKSVAVYVPVDFINKLYNTNTQCIGIGCKDCWHHDGVKSIYGIGYYRTIPRYCGVNRKIHLDVIELNQNSGNLPMPRLHIEPDAELDGTCHIVEAFDVRYITDKHLNECIGIR